MVGKDSTHFVQSGIVADKLFHQAVSVALEQQIFDFVETVFQIEQDLTLALDDAPGYGCHHGQRCIPVAAVLSQPLMPQREETGMFAVAGHQQSGGEEYRHLLRCKFKIFCFRCEWFEQQVEIARKCLEARRVARPLSLGDSVLIQAQHAAKQFFLLNGRFILQVDPQL